MRSALALVYLPQYDEGHSMKLVEPMLCGTPSIALDRGAMREVIDHEVTGYLIHSMAELPAAVNWCATVDRQKVRAAAFERWSTVAAAERVLAASTDVMEGARW